MIIKLNEHTGKRFGNSKDIRKIAELNIQFPNKYSYIHLMPCFSHYSGKFFHYGKERVQIAPPECSCNYFNDIKSIYGELYDIRKLCPHIIKKLFQMSGNGLIEIDNLTILLLENQLKFGVSNILRIPIQETNVYFGFNSNKITDWINIYCVTADNNNVYYNYGYNLTEKRWKRSLMPFCQTEIEEFLIKLKIVKAGHN